MQKSCWGFTEFAFVSITFSHQSIKTDSMQKNILGSEKIRFYQLVMFKDKYNSNYYPVLILVPANFEIAA